MTFTTSNLEKARVLSQAKLDNAAIAILEETNQRTAATIRMFLEKQIKELAKNAPKDEQRNWLILCSQISRGKIPTEAYVALRMTEFTYRRIFELADRELKEGIS